MAETRATMIPFVERMPRPPMVEEHRSMSWITDRLAGIPLGQTPVWWWCTIAVTGRWPLLVSSVSFICFSPEWASGEIISQLPGPGGSPILSFGSALAMPAR